MEPPPPMEPPVPMETQESLLEPACQVWRLAGQGTGMRGKEPSGIPRPVPAVASAAGQGKGQRGKEPSGIPRPGPAADMQPMRPCQQPFGSLLAAAEEALQATPPRAGHGGSGLIGFLSSRLGGPPALRSMGSLAVGVQPDQLYSELEDFLADSG